MKTSNKLVYKETKTIGKERITVTIKLTDDCKNGHEDFSITCVGYELHRRRWIESFGGCAHDEILKFWPEFKIFTDVHLWSHGGYPMYAVENGFYHIKNGFTSCEVESPDFAEKYCNYYHITLDQFNELKDSETKVEFSSLLVDLGICKAWEERIKEPIRQLERLTGTKFKSAFDYGKRAVKIDTEELKKFRKRKSEGYYSKEQKEQREAKRLDKLKESMLTKVESDFQQIIKRYEYEKQIKLAFINYGFEICPITGNMKGAIYYSHTNELNFNCSTDKVHESHIIDFANQLDKELFQGLKITNDKTFLMEI